MGQLQHVHITYCDPAVEGFTGTSVIKGYLPVPWKSCHLQGIHDILFVGTVEYGGGNLPTQSLGSQTQVGLQHLSNIHTGGHAQGIEHYLKGSSIGQEGHILFGQYPGDNPLVTMPTRHLIPYGDLSLLGHIDPYQLIDSGGQFVSVLPGEDLNIHNYAAFPMGNPEGGIPDFTCLFPEYGPEQSFLGGKFGFALGRHLSYQYIISPYFGSNPYDTPLIQIPQGILPCIGYIPGYLFGTQLGITGLGFIFLYMNGCIYVILDQLLTDKDSVLKVITFPGHKAHENILAKSYLPVIRGCSVGDNLACLNLFPNLYYGFLVDTGTLVGSLELMEIVGSYFSLVVPDLDVGSRKLDDYTVFPGYNNHTGIPGGLVFHPRTYDGGFRPDKGYPLALHVCSHKSPVGVIVFQEGDHSGCNRNYLLGGYVHKVYAVLVNLMDIVLDPGHNPIVYKTAFLVQGFITLGYNEFILLIGGKIDYLIGYNVPLLIHLPIRGFDETILIDSGIGAQGTNKPDIGTLRSLDGAHASVVGVVNVPNLKTCPFTA